MDKSNHHKILEKKISEPSCKNHNQYSSWEILAFSYHLPNKEVIRLFFSSMWTKLYKKNFPKWPKSNFGSCLFFLNHGWRTTSWSGKRAFSNWSALPTLNNFISSIFTIQRISKTLVDGSGNCEGVSRMVAFLVSEYFSSLTFTLHCF